jgi:hypothetical protein
VATGKNVNVTVAAYLTAEDQLIRYETLRDLGNSAVLIYGLGYLHSENR